MLPLVRPRIEADPPAVSVVDGYLPLPRAIGGVATP